MVSSILPPVSIVVASRNRPDSLRRLLESIRRQSYPELQVIVVDDASETPLAPPDDALLLRNERNRGASASRNLGALAAQGDLLLFCDDDAELGHSDCVRRAATLAMNHPEAGAIAFRQLRPDGGQHYMQPSSSLEPCYASRFYSYGVVLRANAFRDAGNFDEQLGFYYEEIELSLRLLDAGWRIICDPSLSVIHHEDPRGRNRQMIYRRMLRNMILTALLRYPVPYVAPGVALALTRYLRWTRADGGIDWRGINWVARQVANATPYVRRNRKAVRFATLRMVRQLSRHPVPLGAAAAAGLTAGLAEPASGSKAG